MTFGSFNNFSKVNDRVIELWAEVLNRVAGSHLLLKANGLDQQSVQTRVREAFARFGIAAERIVMTGKQLMTAEHLARYHDVDIALDTFPYNGTTTTCEALWMGVPVVTLAGDTHMSRVGVSLLSSIGLGRLVAQDSQSYVKAAAELAGDLEELARLRTSLRETIERSALRDEKGFTKDLEAALRNVWREWCAR